MQGLEGIVVTDTRLSEVDGERGRLLIAGEPVERVADGGFERACALLWDGAPPAQTRVKQLTKALGDARMRAYAVLPSLGAALDREDGMDALRAAMAQLAPTPDVAISLTGAAAVFATAWARRRAGCNVLAPQQNATHAADYLRMLHGSAPSEAAARALDAYLATVCEHGMNASTFVARTVASTGSDEVSAVVAAIGALKGPLHGGAPGPVLDMLDAIGDAQQADSWLRAELAAGRRIMGMGHRIYRARDPRAAVLECALAGLGEAGQSSANARVVLAREVERRAEALLRERHAGRALCANVEFFTAVLLEALGLDRSLFSATFAAGRVAGWCAHIAEQRSAGRLIRPRSRYVGRRPAA